MSRNQTWLLSWNPDNWAWETLSADRAATHAGNTVTHRWACANRRARIDDTAYLLRTAVPPRGIVARGTIISDPYEAPHWDAAKAAQDHTRWYVDVEFSRIQDPLQNDPFITAEDLSRITIDEQDWSPPSSGVEIQSRSASALDKIWQQFMLPTISKPPDIKAPTNLIYYGPPGTGKTRALMRERQTYISTEQAVSRDAWLIQHLLNARWFDAIFGALYGLGGQASVKSILDHEFIQLKARALDRSRHVRAQIWGELQAHTIVESATVNYSRRVQPQIFDKTPDGTWMLTGDWREQCEDLIDQVETWQAGPPIGKSQDRYEFVTFHQAYSYEDFIEGIRPQTDDDTGEISYQVVAGIFRRLCERAKADPTQRYAMFIDEINRGNIAKIFGELITLLEADKRAVYDDNGQLLDGMELTLPYSGQRFGVPKNLDVFGAMNTADRSIALLDTALRRRFQFRELMPDVSVIQGSRGDGYIEDGEGGLISLQDLVKTMNRRLQFLLNRDLTLGHAYFTGVSDFNGLKHVLLDQIIPLLQEYFYDDWHRIQLVFRDVDPTGASLKPQIICHQSLDAQTVLGNEYDGYNTRIDYWVVSADQLTPDMVRKVYDNRY